VQPRARSGRGTRNLEESSLWIVPNNLLACRSAQATAASSLGLNEQAFACAQSLMWRGKHSQQQTWLQRLKREKWLRLLSGRMLRPSLSQTFATEWASCLPVIPANRSARQANAKAQQTSDTCGHTSQTELPLASPDLCSAKMSRDICPLGLKTFSTTWTDWVTNTRQDYLVRRKSAQHTGENGCSGWPTPAAHEPRLGYQNRNNGKKGSQKSLTTVVIEAGQPAQGNPSSIGKNPERWPTPNTMDVLPPRPTRKLEEENRVRGGRKNRQALSNLREAVQSPKYQKWATPLENDHWITNQPRKDNRQEQLPQMVQKWATPILGDSHLTSTPEAAAARLTEDKKTLSRMNPGKLNPNWVEQLMGVPVGWTQLPTEWIG